MPPVVHVLVIVLFVILFSSYHCSQHPHSRSFYPHCYRLVMYLIAFGFTLDPQGNRVLFKLSSHRDLSALSQSQMLKKPALNRGKMEEKEHVSNGVLKPEAQVPKQCSVPPDAVRYEAECLRTDFNLRIKQVLFQSLLCAYYVGFIPMKFSEVSFFFSVLCKEELSSSQLHLACDAYGNEVIFVCSAG